jgi:hypothetical protein
VPLIQLTKDLHDGDRSRSPAHRPALFGIRRVCAPHASFDASLELSL